MFYTHNHVSGILLNKKIIGRVCFNNHKHAEVSCIESNKHKLKKNKNYTLFSFRFDKKYNLKNAKPCIHCLHVIKKYHNISNVIYSDDDKLIEEKVCNIQTTHISKKFKF
ncbi:hypothetical protein IIV30_091L [Invertebrate iridescent virus 30]|uniref:Uncharacterized protein n=1 Tax=Invertebrate iridescent virus 30 TaxID=345585 RepID=W8W264_9VIRU|nr:hypothetical protein IIV30_091L [Invertebrate iridescent virus 30]CCV02286.1 hypothetical protein IIV30_091L [Invertebrate iridescent virus 30]